MTRLGVHINRLDSNARRFLNNARPKIVKTLAHTPEWGDLRAAHGIEFLLGREWLDPYITLSPTPVKAANELYKRMSNLMNSMRGYYDAWEVPVNEKYQRPWEGLAEYGEFTKEFCRLAHLEGHKVAVGNFSVHNPQVDELPLYYPGLELADYISLHEYWLPGNFNMGVWAGRHKAIYNSLPVELRRPIIISECGIDGGLAGRPGTGYKTLTNENLYHDMLRDYSDTLDSNVIGMCIFCCGNYGDWDDFDIGSSGVIANLIKNYVPKGNKPPVMETPDVNKYNLPVIECLPGLTAYDARGLCPSGHPSVSVHDKQVVIIHGTGSPSHADIDIISLIKSIQAEHVQYGGCGYNMVIAKNGDRFYVGDWNTSRAGAAQLASLNDISYHVCLAGHFNKPYYPTNEQKLSTREVLASLDHALGRRLITAPHYLFNTTDAQRSKWNTTCPGDTFREWVGDILPLRAS